MLPPTRSATDVKMLISVLRRLRVPVALRSRVIWEYHDPAFVGVGHPGTGETIRATSSSWSARICLCVRWRRSLYDHSTRHGWRKYSRRKSFPGMDIQEGSSATTVPSLLATSGLKLARNGNVNRGPHQYIIPEWTWLKGGTESWKKAWDSVFTSSRRQKLKRPKNSQEQLIQTTTKFGQ